MTQERPVALAAALQEMIATVKANQPRHRLPDPCHRMARWFLRRQARRDLAQALVMARSAAAKSPKFGFALERVAEMEFSLAAPSRH